MGDSAWGYQTGDALQYELLRANAELHKKHPTQAEATLWNALKGKGVEGYKFRRQHIVSRFIADFICLRKCLIVEVDGGIHQLPENAVNDELRTDHLRALGFEVIRFTNEEVIGNTVWVIEMIAQKLRELPEKPLWFQARQK